MAESAAYLRVSRTRIFQVLAAGELKGVRIGKHRCVTRTSLDAFVERLEAQ